MRLQASMALGYLNGQKPEDVLYLLTEILCGLSGQQLDALAEAVIVEIRARKTKGTTRSRVSSGV